MLVPLTTSTVRGCLTLTVHFTASLTRQTEGMIGDFTSLARRSINLSSVSSFKLLQKLRARLKIYGKEMSIKYDIKRWHIAYPSLLAWITNCGNYDKSPCCLHVYSKSWLHTCINDHKTKKCIWLWAYSFHFSLHSSYPSIISLHNYVVPSNLNTKHTRSENRAIKLHFKTNYGCSGSTASLPFSL